MTQYDFACCNLETEIQYSKVDYKSSNSIITMERLSSLGLCKDKTNISDGIETPNTPEPMVMNIFDTINVYTLQILPIKNCNHN